MKRYVVSSTDISDLPSGRYLVKYGVPYYSVRFVFHDCTYDLYPLSDVKGYDQPIHMLSADEYKDFVEAGRWKEITKR